VVATPLIDWPEFFSTVKPGGVEISAKLRQLDGKRVRLRGYSLIEPVPRGGLFLTRLPAGRLHPDDFDTLPWDAVAVLWRPGLELPPIPARPTVEGVLRLGNRKVEEENVFLLLEDAVPAPQKNSGESDSLPAVPGVGAALHGFFPAPPSRSPTKKAHPMNPL
jgi:hypothetical protein